MLVDEKLDMSWQWALAVQKAKCVLGCIQSSVASRVREGILPLCSAETPLGVLQTWSRKGKGLLEHIEEATKMIRGLDPLCCENRLEELGLFSLKKRKLQGELIVAFRSVTEKDVITLLRVH
ncbi:hypothetical protein TURU_049773 [Turdus rufiventris]|nr:hypothetical protein TURU_049773 [Turdus rufiventris]